MHRRNESLVFFHNFKAAEISVQAQILCVHYIYKPMLAYSTATSHTGCKLKACLKFYVLHSKKGSVHWLGSVAVCVVLTRRMGDLMVGKNRRKHLGSTELPLF